MKRAGVVLLLLMCSCGVLLAFQAPPQLDCTVYVDSVGVEPPGYAEQCLGVTPGISPSPPSTSTPRFPADQAIAHDIGFVSDNFVNHPVGDLSAQTVVGTSADDIFGYDFDPQGEFLYAIRNSDQGFGISINNGTFARIGTATPLSVHTWTGLAVDPVDGTIYASSSGGTSAIYTIDPDTGSATLLFEAENVSSLIDIAMNCEGELYGHEISTDNLVRIDLSSRSMRLVGPTGVNANFAQGMDFDNSDGKLYIHAYQGGGANTYGTVNLATGAITPINVNDPQGEFEGAIPTTCPLLDFFIGD